MDRYRPPAPVSVSSTGSDCRHVVHVPPRDPAVGVPFCRNRNHQWKKEKEPERDALLAQFLRLRIRTPLRRYNKTLHLNPPGGSNHTLVRFLSPSLLQEVLSRLLPGFASLNIGSSLTVVHSPLWRIFLSTDS